jgi:hypothetical protein
MFAGYASVATGLFALLPVPAPVLGAAVIVGSAAMLMLVLYGARVGSRAATEISNESTVD